jgi:hypothetical protein
MHLSTADDSQCAAGHQRGAVGSPVSPRTVANISDPELPDPQFSRALFFLYHLLGGFYGANVCPYGQPIF